MHRNSRINGFFYIVVIFAIGSCERLYNISLFRDVPSKYQFDRFKIQKDENSRPSCAQLGGKEIFHSPTACSCVCPTKNNTFGTIKNVVGCFDPAQFVREEGCDISLKDQPQLTTASPLNLLNTTENCVVEKVQYLTCDGNLVSVDNTKTIPFQIFPASGPDQKTGFALEIRLSKKSEFHGQLIKLSLKCSDNTDRRTTCLMIKLNGKTSCKISMKLTTTRATPLVTRNNAITSLDKPTAINFQPTSHDPIFPLISRTTVFPLSGEKTNTIINPSLSLISVGRSAVAEDESKNYSVLISTKSTTSPKTRKKAPQAAVVNGTLSAPVLAGIACAFVFLVFVIVLVFAVRRRKFRKQTRTLENQGAGAEITDYARVQISNRRSLNRQDDNETSSSQGDYATVQIPPPKKAKHGQDYQSLGTKKPMDRNYARLYNSPKETRRLQQNGHNSDFSSQESGRNNPEVQGLPNNNQENAVNNDYQVLEGPDPNVKSVGEPMYHVLES